MCSFLSFCSPLLCRIPGLYFACRFLATLYAFYGHTDRLRYDEPCTPYGFWNSLASLVFTQTHGAYKRDGPPRNGKCFSLSSLSPYDGERQGDEEERKVYHRIWGISFGRTNWSNSVLAFNGHAEIWLSSEFRLCDITYFSIFFSHAHQFDFYRRFSNLTWHQTFEISCVLIAFRNKFIRRFRHLPM